MEESKYYNYLKQKKAIGELFDFQKIDFNQLKLLWWDEKCSDKMIANLFGISPYKVTAKRNQFGLMRRDMAMEEFLDSFNKELHPITKEPWPEARDLKEAIRLFLQERK